MKIDDQFDIISCLSHVEKLSGIDQNVLKQLCERGITISDVCEIFKKLDQPVSNKFLKINT